MSVNPIRDDRLTELVRDFLHEVRVFLAKKRTDDEMETLVTRFLAALGLALGVVLSLRRRQEDFAAALMAVAVRMWAKRPENGE